MSLNRYAKRRDANHRTVVAALRKAGCDVEEPDICDALVGRASRNFMLEIKPVGRSSESRISDRQKRLRSSWRGHYAIVTTIAEALAAVGL